MFAGMMDKNNGKNRMIAFVILTALLVITLFSSCYILQEAHHDCSDASCPVCAMIEQCEHNLRQMGTGQVFVTIVAAAIWFVCHEFSTLNAELSFETLITRKVRLND